MLNTSFDLSQTIFLYLAGQGDKKAVGPRLTILHFQSDRLPHLSSNFISDNRFLGNFAGDDEGKTTETQIVFYRFQNQRTFFRTFPFFQNLTDVFLFPEPMFGCQHNKLNGQTPSFFIPPAG